MQTTDHLTDPLRIAFVKLAHQYEVPDYVKAATDEQLQAPTGNTGRVYALPSRKALPLHNKVAAWLSAVYLDGGEGHFSEYERKTAARNLQAAANVYGIEWPKKIAEASEAAPKDEDYLISMTSDQGVRRRLPVRSAEEAKVAMAYLKEHRLELPWGVRRQASQNLLAKVAHYKVAISDTDRHLLDLDASNFVAEPDQLSELLKGRSLVAAHLGLQDQADKLLKLSKEVAAPNGVVVEGDLAGEILGAVEEFDRSIGRKSAAVDQIPVVVNSQFEDWASNVCVFKSGHVYDRRKFNKAHLEGILVAADCKPEDIADVTGLWIDVEKSAAFFENIDEHKANRVASVLKKAGVNCDAFIEKEARLTEDELKVLAGG